MADPLWSDPMFGDYKFGDYKFGDWTWSVTTTWGDWVPDTPGSNPADCTSNNPHVVFGSIIDTFTPGAITPGTITDGLITDGLITDLGITYLDITPGAVTPTGSAHLYVNGTALS